MISRLRPFIAPTIGVLGFVASLSYFAGEMHEWGIQNREQEKEREVSRIIAVEVNDPNCISLVGQGGRREQFSKVGNDKFVPLDNVCCEAHMRGYSSVFDANNPDSFIRNLRSVKINKINNESDVVYDVNPLPAKKVYANTDTRISTNIIDDPHTHAIAKGSDGQYYVREPLLKSTMNYAILKYYEDDWNELSREGKLIDVILHLCPLTWGVERAMDDMHKRWSEEEAKGEEKSKTPSSYINFNKLEELDETVYASILNSTWIPEKELKKSVKFAKGVKLEDINLGRDAPVVNSYLEDYVKHHE